MAISAWMFLFASCGFYHGNRTGTAYKDREVGIASWYGKKFHGRPTASGEIYNMYDMTAAHKTLPLGTIVRVRSLATNKKTIVKINDRGPFIRGRIIDLSLSAAREIGIDVTGTAKVVLEVLSYPPEYTRSGRKQDRYELQVGAFSNRKNALRLKAVLKKRFPKYSTHINGVETDEGKIYRLRLGYFKSVKRAESFSSKLKYELDLDSFTISAPRKVEAIRLVVGHNLQGAFKNTK